MAADRAWVELVRTALPRHPEFEDYGVTGARRSPRLAALRARRPPGLEGGGAYGDFSSLIIAITRSTRPNKAWAEMVEEVSARGWHHAQEARTLAGHSVRVDVFDRDGPGPAMVYFHGVGGDITWHSKETGYLLRASRPPSRLVVIDWMAGPTLTTLHRVIEAGDALVVEEAVRAGSLVVGGFSMGAAVAAHAATQTPAAPAVLALMLVGAFSRLADARWVPPEFVLRAMGSATLPVAEWVRAAQCPVVCAHGARDDRVPFGSGAALAAVVSDVTGRPATFLPFPDGPHTITEDAVVSATMDAAAAHRDARALGAPPSRRAGGR